jgi:hypothetical protein
MMEIPFAALTVIIGVVLLSLENDPVLISRPPGRPW